MPQKMKSRVVLNVSDKTHAASQYLSDAEVTHGQQIKLNICHTCTIFPRNEKISFLKMTSMPCLGRMESLQKLSFEHKWGEK